MKTLNQTLSLVSIATLMTFSAACSKSLQREKILPANVSSKAMANSSLDGTTDGGGGNAIDNRMLESYIIKPEELTATKVHLAKKLTTIFSSKDDPNALAIFRFKTWYLVPTSLKNVSKKALGIEFTEDQTQQVAIQTKDEVWIDATIFNKMTQEEQAKLVLHEALMTFYMTRFMPLSELCVRNEKAGFKSCNIKEIDYKKIDNIYKPEKERPLVGQDYNAIRTMTNWVWDADANLSAQDFHRISKAAGFDKRFSYDSTEETPELKIPANKFTMTLEAARLGNKLQKVCTTLQSKKSYPCEVSWTFSKGNYDATEIRLAVRDTETKATVLDTVLTIYKEVIAPGYTQNGQILRAVIQMSAGVFGSYQNGISVPAQPGTVGYFVDFTLNDKGTELKGLFIQPLVNIGSYDEEKEVTNPDGTKQRQTCKVTEIVKREGESLHEEAFVVGDVETMLPHAETFSMASFGGTSSCTAIPNKQ